VLGGPRGYMNRLFHGLAYHKPNVMDGVVSYARNTFREGRIRHGSYFAGDIVELQLAEILLRCTTCHMRPVVREFRFELDYTSPDVWDYWSHTPPHESEGQWLPIEDWIVLEDRRHFPEPTREPEMKVCSFWPTTVGELAIEDRRDTRYRRHSFFTSNDHSVVSVPRDDRVVERHGIISGGTDWFVADRIVPLLEPHVIEPYLFWFDFEELPEP
jgi:hypothetical protein